MRSFKDEAIAFDCEGETLFGVLSAPAQAATTGVVLIVGGPQYRVGSHRQFVELARTLAQRGIAVLRFDYRGMGDSGGAPRDFEHIDADIRAAVDALLAHCPGLRQLALWGLCDAASAACMYAAKDERVGAMVLLNPWVRDTNTYARAQVKHYYGTRLLQKSFWQKLLRGEVRVLRSTRETAAALFRSLRKAPRSTASPPSAFQVRMLQGLQDYRGPVLLFISGRDLTASEFCDLSRADPRWDALLREKRVQRVELNEADHTFSTRPWKNQVEESCAQWLLGLNQQGTR